MRTARGIVLPRNLSGVEGGGGGGVEGAGFVGSFWLAHQITQIIAKPDDLT